MEMTSMPSPSDPGDGGPWAIGTVLRKSTDDGYPPEPPVNTFVQDSYGHIFYRPGRWWYCYGCDYDIYDDLSEGAYQFGWELVVDDSDGVVTIVEDPMITEIETNKILAHAEKGMKRWAGALEKLRELGD